MRGKKENTVIPERAGHSIGNDDTGTKNTRREPHEGKALRDLIDLTTHWLWEVDENGLCTYLSPKVKDTLGYEAEEIIGRPAREFMSEEEVRRVIPAFEKIYLERKPFSFLEYRILHKDGRERVLESSGVPRFDEEGTFRGFVGVDRDITERRNIEEDLLAKTKSLEEANTAFKVLLDHREQDRMEVEEKLVFNIKKLVLPYIQKLKRQQGHMVQTLAVIAERNLEDILSPLMHSVASKYPALSTVELQVIDLIRHGHESKEIADILRVSVRTVEVHRFNIRKKLGIRGARINLKSFLSSM